MTDAYNEVIRRGLDEEADYKYTDENGAQNNTCRRKNNQYSIKIKGYQTIQPGNEEHLKIAVATRMSIKIIIQNIL